MRKRKEIFALVLLLCMFLLSCASNQVPLETEKIVSLYVPECAGWGDEPDRIGSILRGVEGVLNVKIDTTTYTATIAFVPEKSSVEKLIRALETEGFKILGSPELLK